MSKKLVAYFSASGTTKAIAEDLARISGADIYRIEPEVPYTSADLNWKDENSRSSIEMKDHSSRPAIKDTTARPDSYDLIYLGFPIWWYIAPTIINTFLEKYDLSGKSIVLFATSGSSDFGQTVDILKQSVTPNTTMIAGKVFHEKATETDLKVLADF